MYQSWRSSCYLVNTEEFRQIYQHLYHFMDTVLTNNQLCSFQIKSHSRRKKMKTLISVPSFAIIIVTVICVLTFIYNYFILPTLEKNNNNRRSIFFDNGWNSSYFFGRLLLLFICRIWIFYKNFILRSITFYMFDLPFSS